MSPKWDQPAPPADYFKPRDYMGQLIAFEVLEWLPNYTLPMTKDGEEGGTKCNVTILSGLLAGKVYRETVVVQNLKYTLREGLPPTGSGWILGRIETAAAKPGQSAAFILSEFTPEDEAAANAFFENGTPAPAAAPAAPAQSYTPPAPAAPAAPTLTDAERAAKIAELEAMLGRGEKAPY